jgi:hypothetical protein
MWACEVKMLFKKYSYLVNVNVKKKKTWIAMSKLSFILQFSYDEQGTAGSRGIKCNTKEGSP